jgi:hypothetical protein
MLALLHLDSIVHLHPVEAAVALLIAVPLAWLAVRRARTAR